MNTPSPRARHVARRLVYYLAGFDTRSARFYHQLYQTEARLQQTVNGCEYEIGDPEPDGPHAVTWTVKGRHAEGGQVDTRYSFLQWNDIFPLWAGWPPRLRRSAPQRWRRGHGAGGSGGCRAGDQGRAHRNRAVPCLLADAGLEFPAVLGPPRARPAPAALGCFTAPTDPLCYALVNPFTACGLPAPSHPGYRLKSARFDRMFRPEDYAQVRRDYFRIHFQYLMST
ncbi:MAG: hypothetical protein ABIU58_10960 [Ramlibacter sp.]